MAATALADYSDYRQGFKAFVAKRREPDGLLKLRRQALACFDSLGIPSTREEAWRFTELSALAQVSFKRAGDVPVDASMLPVLAGRCHRLVFVNGRFAPGLSRLQALPDKALVASLGQALRTHPEIVQAHLGRFQGLEEHPFMALNSAFWEDGAFVYLPRRTVLEHPLHLVFYTTGADTMSHPRNLIVLEEGVHASIVGDYRGEGRYLSCPVTEIRVENGAVMSYHRIHEESAQAWCLGGLRLYQGRDSHIDAHLMSMGGQLVRTDIDALLDGEGAECILNGLTLVADGQVGDQHIRLEHATPNATSQQHFKGVLEGKSRTVFDALIHVRKDAQKTQAMQNNRNLLLSRQALANSNPRLEILADDVKCSHGSTVGFLDPDALFYLRSRGIGEAEARAMLVYAFANESIEHIRLTPLRERLEALLRGRLYFDSAERQVL